MIGRTHGVHAEPITFGLKLAVWMDEMRRNQRRLAEARRTIAVGKISGAVGTYATVPPEVEEPFAAGQTGSSAMPHKRNPELGERVSGLARLIRGHAVTALENQALWHERDISHSSNERIILPDSCLALDYILNIFTSIINGLQVFPKRMKKNLELTRGLVFSQRVMLALIDKKLSRQEAYKLVQRNAMKAWSNNRNFLTLLKRDAEVMAVIKPDELEDIFDYKFYMGHVNEIFNRLGLTESQWGEPLPVKRRGKLSPGTIQSN